ncbi:MAG: hypothetical protein MUO89_04980 [Dehalococcoidia bacterium]|nr:hypothetical protein [Dehalococcoidia bacterium]
MKRYRVLSFDFDSRVHSLTQEIRDDWEDEVKKQHLQSKDDIEKGLVISYGLEAHEAKRQNFIELGDKSLSILAFHNRFFEQIRTAFVMGAYYPALTATCALGERILNYLILLLRDDYRHTPEYKTVSRKDSFDNWDIAINTLESWNVLLPDVTKEFHRLKDLRHKAIHFRPGVDLNDRALALEAIRCLREIISNQFSAFGSQPWFITNIPGEIYIKKSWESNPFIQKVYLPNCRAVGPRHQIEALFPQVVVKDITQYGEREVTDEEFSELRNKQK